MSGGANVSVAKLGNLAVTCVHSPTPSPVIIAGSLASLDMTFTGSFTVASVTISATNLEFQYTASSSTCAMSGVASVSVAKLGNLPVTFGHDATPGLVIIGGSLASLDMTF